MLKSVNSRQNTKMNALKSCCSLVTSQHFKILLTFWTCCFLQTSNLNIQITSVKVNAWHVYHHHFFAAVNRISISSTHITILSAHFHTDRFKCRTQHGTQLVNACLLLYIAEDCVPLTKSMWKLCPILPELCFFFLPLIRAPVTGRFKLLVTLYFLIW